VLIIAWKAGHSWAQNGDEGMRKASTIPERNFFISLESQAVSKSLEVDIAIKAGSRRTLSKG